MLELEYSLMIKQSKGLTVQFKIVYPSIPAREDETYVYISTNTPQFRIITTNLHVCVWS